MAYRRIEVSPISGALGAEIDGIDLAKPLDDETFAEVRKAFDENLIIFFRDQKITPEQHLAFAGRFGEFDIHPFAAGLPDHPEVLPVIKEADDRGGNFGGLWHSDVTFYERPPLGSILYALDVPAYGGDTMFANQYLAYETLSDGLKEMLDGMTAVHSAKRVYGNVGTAVRKYGAGVKSMNVRTGEDAEETVEHPVVRLIPETGRKALFLNRSYALRFSGWTEAESDPLLEYLCNHAARPEFTCRFRWRNGSIAFWDNRCAQHNALNDYHGQRREMHRVTIVGERPMSIQDGNRAAAA
jgi:alpha-ketoglutarate-dependent taurine dioxygenase